jgi:hypothetical protein
MCIASVRLTHFTILCFISVFIAQKASIEILSLDTKDECHHELVVGWLNSSVTGTLLLYYCWLRYTDHVGVIKKSPIIQQCCGNNVCRWYTFILLWEVNTCVSRFSQYHLTISLWICTILLFSFSGFSIDLPLFSRWGQMRPVELRIKTRPCNFSVLISVFFVKRVCYLQSLKPWVHKISTQYSFSFSSILNNRWE